METQTNQNTASQAILAGLSGQSAVAAEAAAAILKEANRQDKIGETVTVTGPMGSQMQVPAKTTTQQIADKAKVPEAAVQATVERLATEAKASNAKIAGKKPPVVAKTAGKTNKVSIPAPAIKRASRLGDTTGKVLEALKKATRGVGLSVADMAKTFNVPERDIRLAIDKNRALAAKSGAARIERLNKNMFGFPKVAPAPKKG